jgi:hypothetical protein
MSRCHHEPETFEEPGLLPPEDAEPVLKLLHVLDVTVELGEVMRLFGQPEVDLYPV